MRRFRLSLAAALAASLVLASCGGDDPEGDEEAAEPKGTGDAQVLASTWPLTGLDVTGDASAEKKHPVMVVKIDNTASAAPQVGLGSADLVVEELVEGGSTRLAVFYYSQLPPSAGPVRSMRASDIGIVKPADGVMVTSGAAPVTINRVKGAGIEFFGEGSPGSYRDSGRSAPYNLMVRLKELAGSIAEKPARPDDYLPFGTSKDLPKGQKATSLAATFSAGRTTNWSFQGGQYRNDNTYAADGDEFTADTVLVLRVQVGDAGYRDPAGNPVPETKFEGDGQAMVFHGGRLVRGQWSKADLASPLKLRTKAGKLTVPAGNTWIELVPAKEGKVTFGK
ncbi:DUF3048 domain-containing protein [Nocardioides donggukensis]|uniref:DUF3048 domain-containing protein n=1 Tax=Nocardioides donggukensis TaxID=2774019 RepID=A0A927K307_9ACTN|nr:DUF3048 domain-containing protein [Nocardioides donggukensis]MBD8868791.1 DUF3048 domain-containing protein [Nocardioides donggukensis]